LPGLVRKFDAVAFESLRLLFWKENRSHFVEGAILTVDSQLFCQCWTRVAFAHRALPLRTIDRRRRNGRIPRWDRPARRSSVDRRTPFEPKGNPHSR